MKVTLQESLSVAGIDPSQYKQLQSSEENTTEMGRTRTFASGVDPAYLTPYNTIPPTSYLGVESPDTYKDIDESLFDLMDELEDVEFPDMTVAPAVPSNTPFPQLPRQVSARDVRLSPAPVASTSGDTSTGEPRDFPQQELSSTKSTQNTNYSTISDSRLQIRLRKTDSDAISSAQAMEQLLDMQVSLQDQAAITTHHSHISGGNPTIMSNLLASGGGTGDSNVSRDQFPPSVSPKPPPKMSTPHAKVPIKSEASSSRVSSSEGEFYDKPVKSRPIDVGAVHDRNKRNAIQARLNRQKKKAYVETLEEQMEQLRETSASFQQENETLKNDNHELREEVLYLRNILTNDSALAGLLKDVGHSKQARLSSSFFRQKRTSSQAEMDDNRPLKMGGGVCLHVDKDDVSIELCAKCSQMAQSASRCNVKPDT